MAQNVTAETRGQWGQVEHQIPQYESNCTIVTNLLLPSDDRYKTAAGRSLQNGCRTIVTKRLPDDRYKTGVVG
jgi:hypothetical protein